MKIGIRKSGVVVIFLTMILLSACAEGATSDVLTGTLSKPGGDLALLGTVEEISESIWKVSGRTIKLSDDTNLDNDLRIGDSVWVDVTLGDDGFMNALVIEASSPDMFVVGAEFEFYGTVEEITPTLWLIGGFEVTVTPDTEIKADIEVGDFVEVHANFNEEGVLVSREIELPDGDEDEDDHDRIEIEFVGVVEDITDDVWTVQGLVLTITPRTEIEGFIQVGDLVKVHAYFGDGDMLIAREVKLAETDEDDDDHDREEVEFIGTVGAISDIEWVIDGRIVLVTPDTEIEDDIIVGDVVNVEAYENEDGSLVAHEIELAGDDDDDDDADDRDDDNDDRDEDEHDDDDADDHDDDHDDDDRDDDDDHEEHDDDRDEHDDHD